MVVPAGVTAMAVMVGMDGMVGIVGLVAEPGDPEQAVKTNRLNTAARNRKIMTCHPSLFLSVRLGRHSSQDVTS